MTTTSNGTCCCTANSCVSITHLQIGQSATICSIKASSVLGRRLRDMGLSTGMQLTVTNRAPLGCPIVVSLDGYEISLRCEEAAQIFVEKI